MHVVSKQNGVKQHNMIELEYLQIIDSIGKMMKSITSKKNSTNTSEHVTKPLDLKIDLENFGPVKKGTVQLKPLTIFIGPNNSGKSYVSVLLHSLLRASRNTHLDPETLSPDLVNDLAGQLPSVTSKMHMTVPSTITTKIHDICMQSFSKKIGEQLSYNFKSDLEKLVKRGKTSIRITLSNQNTVNVTIKKKVSAKSSMANKKFTIKLFNNVSSKLVQENKTETIINITPNMITFVPHMLYNHIWSVVLQPSLDSHYLPAARSGILQTYKIIAASLVSIKSRAEDTFPTHTLTGTIADFVSDLITIPEQEGTLANIAKQMEHDLFAGSIDLPRSRDKFPEMTYTSDGHQIPIHRASSTISEVAPLSMYLKYIADKGDLLVIEEPEAHLHPMNQSKMAKNIVKMIRAGLNVLITTHSAYLIERLGQYMVAGMTDSKSRIKHKSYKNEYLLPDEVSPYIFKRSQGGYLIHEIEKNSEYGISQEEFISVLEDLNDESITLQKELLKKTYADI